MKEQIIDILNELPKMRWNILDEQGYFGDEWDNFEHMDEDERWEYFKKIYGTLKKIKDLTEK